MTLLLTALGALVGGYAVRLWQETWNEWRCDFLQKYTMRSGGKTDYMARCEYHRGHQGPHRTRAPGYPPDHFANALTDAAE